MKMIFVALVAVGLLPGLLLILECGRVVRKESSLRAEADARALTGERDLRNRERLFAYQVQWELPLFQRSITINPRHWAVATAWIGLLLYAFSVVFLLYVTKTY